MRPRAFVIVVALSLAAATEGKGEVVFSQTLSGAQLYSDPRVSFPTRTPQLQGTSLFFDTGSTSFEKLLELALFPQNTLDPSASFTLFILANLTVERSASPTYPTDHDPGIGIGDGTLFGGFLAGDNFGGDGGARIYNDLGAVGQGLTFADEIFTGTGYPPIDGSLTVEARITLTAASTEIYGAFGNGSGSHTFTEIFDATAPLNFVFFAHDADERYKLNWVSLEADGTRIVAEPSSLVIFGGAIFLAICRHLRLRLGAERA